MAVACNPKSVSGDAVDFYVRTSPRFCEYTIRHCAANPTTNKQNRTNKVIFTTLAVGPAARGWEAGSRVSVSLTAGTNDRKKLNDSPKSDR